MIVVWLRDELAGMESTQRYFYYSVVLEIHFVQITAVWTPLLKQLNLNFWSM